MNKTFLKYSVVLMLIFNLVISCSDDKENDNDKFNKNLSKDVQVKPENHSVSIGHVNKKVDELLTEIDLCENEENACIVDPVFFPLHEFKSMRSGFALRFHYLNESNKRKTYVYVNNDKDSLVCINKFQGPIIKNDTTKSDFPDLWIRLIDFEPDKRSFYNCWFKFSPKQNKYIYDFCSEIEEKSNDQSMKSMFIFQYGYGDLKQDRLRSEEVGRKIKKLGLF